MGLKLPARWPYAVALFDWSHNIGFEQKWLGHAAQAGRYVVPDQSLLHHCAKNVVDSYHRERVNLETDPFEARGRFLGI
jgi:hypothetical protein